MQKAVRLHGFVIGVVCLALIEGATARAQVDQLLIHSARMGDYAAVLRLVAAGANPNVQDSTGTTGADGSCDARSSLNSAVLVDERG